MKDVIDDLSYSGLSSLIDGGKIVGANVVDVCAKELVYLRGEIDKKEIELNKLKSRVNSLINTPDKILKILKVELPFYVLRENYIIVVEKDNLIIESNII